MLRHLYAPLILATTHVLIAGQAQGQASGWNASQTVQQLKSLGDEGGKVLIQGASTWRYWLLILSAVACGAFLIAAVFGHFKLGWTPKILGGLLGLAALSAIVSAFTGLTLAL
jgi:hypothetical protein